MKRLLVRRGAVGLALGALAATGLASVPAPAHAVVTNAYVYADAGFHNDGDDSCVVAGDGPGPDALPWTDNNVPIALGDSSVGTVTSGGDITDVVTTASASISSSPLGAGPATVKATASASASSIPRSATTICDGHASSESGAYSNFTLAAPMWVTLTLNANGTGDGSVSGGIESSNGQISLQGGKRTSGSVTALLPAGEAYLWFGADANVHSDDTVAARTAAATGTLTFDFQPLGNGSAVTGKGAGYVQFGARECGTGNVAAAITKKAKKKAQQVLVKVNGAKIAKFKGKKLKKRTLVLPAAPSSAAEVVATITLKNGKKVTVTRSYLACS